MIQHDRRVFQPRSIAGHRRNSHRRTDTTSPPLKLYELRSCHEPLGVVIHSAYTAPTQSTPCARCGLRHETREPRAEGKAPAPAARPPAPRAAPPPSAAPSSVPSSLVARASAPRARLRPPRSCLELDSRISRNGGRLGGGTPPLASRAGPRARRSRVSTSSAHPHERLASSRAVVRDVHVAPCDRGLRVPVAARETPPRGCELSGPATVCYTV